MLGIDFPRTATAYQDRARAVARMPTTQLPGLGTSRVAVRVCPVGWV